MEHRKDYYNKMITGILKCKDEGEIKINGVDIKRSIKSQNAILICTR